MNYHTPKCMWLYLGNLYKGDIFMSSKGLNLIHFLNIMSKYSQYGFKSFSETTNDSDVQGIVMCKTPENLVSKLKTQS